MAFAFHGRGLAVDSRTAHPYGPVGPAAHTREIVRSEFGFCRQQQNIVHGHSLRFSGTAGFSSMYAGADQSVFISTLPKLRP
jgi:hypothetical protein